MSADDSLMPVSEGGKTPQNYNVESGQAKFNKDNENVDVQPTTKLIGLTKEQLEQYRNDPFWKPVRYALFILFWLVWLAMFVGAVLIVVLSPKCAIKVEPKWHENLIAYQIYTPTFRDSDADGVGDFKGIQEKLNDLRKIGVTGIWPVPIVKGNKNDYSAREVLDVLQVDERYGTEEDLVSLIDATHNADLHFIIDLPLTVSASNEWAKQNPTVISEKGDNINLLNLENPKVQERLTEAAKHWLKLGVDGIHLADYGFSKKAPRSASKSAKGLIEKIRALASSSHSIRQKDLLIFTDASWASPNNENLNSSENYRVFDLTDGSGPLLDRLDQNIEAGAKLLDGEAVPPMWKLIDVDSPRLDQQLGKELSKGRKQELASVLTLIQLFLPGPVCIYYGQELSLPSNPPAQSPPQHGTMRWDQSSDNAGFSSFTGQNFFRTLDNGTEIYFDLQYKDGLSSLKAFKRLAELRARDNVFQRGEFSAQESDGLHLFSRFMPNSTTDNVYILAANLPVGNTDSIPRKLTKESIKGIAQNRSVSKVEMKVPSAGVKTYHQNQDFDLGKEEILLEPYQAVVIRIV